MPALTLPQARSELKRLFDESYAIVSKNGGAITDEMPNEDRSRLEANKGLILEHEVLIERLSADAADTAMFKNGRDEYGRPSETHRQPAPESPRDAFLSSLGHGFIASDQYQAAKKSGALNQPYHSIVVPLPPDISMVAQAKRAGQRDSKALLTSNDASGGSFVTPDRLSGYTARPRGELAYVDALPTQSTTSDLVEWVQQDARTNAAAPVAEATASTGTSGLKPESGLTFSLQNRAVEQIATHLPITTRILADAPMMRGIIDDELLYMLREVLEVQCMIGNGTTPNLLGLNAWPGTQTLAAGANPADALFSASLAVRFTGGVPATDAIVGPATLSALRLMRENAATGTLGNYLFGAPNAPGPLTVFGLEIITAQACPANTAFVLNMTPTTLALVERQGPTIETGWANDDFTRNIVRIRAELRGAFIVRRPAGVCKVTGMP
jgi:HK97 family phage major capsid protein